MLWMMFFFTFLSPLLSAKFMEVSWLVFWITVAGQQTAALRGG
jgi:hypothetical protein